MGLRPCSEHCQASARNPGAAAQSRARSCQPPPQLLLHCCQSPASIAADSVCCCVINVSLTSAHPNHFSPLASMFAEYGLHACTDSSFSYCFAVDLSSCKQIK